jgi:hypothetical protein
VDEEIAADTGSLAGCGDRAINAAVQAAAYRRDPHSVARRASHAVNERTVTLRPAPDTMTRLTALLPVAQGVAVHAELTRHADALKSSGDERPKSAMRADRLVECVTGTPGGYTGIDLQLVMTDRTLFQVDSEPARLAGYGIVPGEWARKALKGELMTDAGAGHFADDSELQAWLRRLYTAPTSGELVAMDSKARLFPPGLRRFIQVRDDTCRTPYCDAPIRHLDHNIPWHNDGPTTSTNGQGLCEACNHTKETPDWDAKTVTRPGRRHAVETRTPTGHTYRSTAPPLTGSALAMAVKASAPVKPIVREEPLPSVKPLVQVKPPGSAKPSAQLLERGMNRHSTPEKRVAAHSP